MKKIFQILFVALFMLAAAPAFSQFSAGLTAGIPTGDWSNFWGLGWGLDGRYEAAIQDKLNWTASLGFLSYAGKTSNGISAPSITVVPVTGGIKYYFQKSNIGAYAGADAGLWFLSASSNGGSGSTTRFGIAPAIGYRIEKFDFSFRYNAITDFSYAGLRAAYIFPGK